MRSLPKSQRPSGACVVAAVLLAALLLRVAAAQNAFWSLQGEFENAIDPVEVYFDLTGNGVSSSDVLYGAT